MRITVGKRTFEVGAGHEAYSLRVQFSDQGDAVVSMPVGIYEVES